MAIPLRGTGNRARGVARTVPGARGSKLDTIDRHLDRKANLGGSSPQQELSDEERAAVEAIRSGVPLDEALALIPKEDTPDQP